MKKAIIIISCIALVLFLVWAALYYFNRVLPDSRLADYDWDEVADSTANDEIHYWEYEHNDSCKVAKICAYQVSEGVAMMVNIQIRYFSEDRVEVLTYQKGVTGEAIALADDHGGDVVFTGSYSDNIRNGDGDEVPSVKLDDPMGFIDYLRQYPHCCAAYRTAGRKLNTDLYIDLQNGEKLKDFAEW